MSYQSKSIEKTVRLLDICAEQCDKIGFDPRSISRQLRTCNATFYDAVTLGMFTRIEKGRYKVNQDRFTRTDARKIVDFRRDKVAKKETMPQQALIPQDAQYHIEALKSLGYTGVIEKKQVISF